PVTIPSVESLEVREGYIEIQRLPDYELVTSIELLSPWNKYGDSSVPPEPLSPEDSAWASEIARSVAADGRP
ncbi:MAG: hypothetical protein JWN24_4859, partial [Phycisphaerales bacterium]|nr:hypothetical protein [Phycisphaerales bacterium]